MKRTIALICAVLIVMIAGSAAWAQCPEEFTVNVGSGQCISVCAFQEVSINLEGRTFWSIDLLPFCSGCFCLNYVAQDGSQQGVPQLLMIPGCQGAGPNCLEQCPPIPPPTGFILGGDPFYPQDYYGVSQCMQMYMHFDHYLAVDFTSFEAIPGNAQVTLNWSTGSESRNDHFEIKRADANNPQAAVTIGRVTANNLPSGSNYTWTDHGVVNGQTYTYRLTAVDMDGQETQTRTVNGVSPDATQPTVVTAYALYQNYPNPFNPQTSIAFDMVEAGNVTLAVYNVLGEKVSTLMTGHMSSGHHSVMFDGTNLSTGVYFYKLEVNGFTSMKKLVLLK